MYDLACYSRLRSLTAPPQGCARLKSSFLDTIVATNVGLSTIARLSLGAYVSHQASFSDFSVYRKAKTSLALLKSARLALSCPRASVH